ncbi:MAG: endolytic transglycosylase MltG [Anaerovoracaceae bacterium]|jgi:cytoskeletal protein RodZ
MKGHHYNGFRNFIYDTSDILVAVIIILIAALIITWRVSALMNYSYDGGQTGSTEVSQSADSSADSSAQDESSSADTSSTSSGSSTDSSSADSSSTDGAGQVYEITVTQGETIDEIASVLSDAGLISDNQEFIDAVSEAGAESRIAAGTYEIEKGMSAAEIVTQMTS